MTLFMTSLALAMAQPVPQEIPPRAAPTIATARARIVAGPALRRANGRLVLSMTGAQGDTPAHQHNPRRDGADVIDFF